MLSRKVTTRIGKLFMVVMASVLVLAGCKGNEPQPIEEVKVDYPLYVVKDKSGDVKGYMLGTIHVGKPGMTEFPEVMLDAVANTDVVMGELNTDVYLNPQKYSEQMQKSLFLPEGETIFDGMSDEQKEDFLEKMSTYQLKEKDVEKLSRTAILSLTLNAIKGFITTKGVDMEFMNLPGVSELESAEFESVDEQMELLAENQDILSITDWLASIPDAETNQQLIEELFDAYATHTLEEKFDSLFKETDEGITFERNLRWLPQIETQIKAEKTFFIVVGAGHLYGEKGLIPLLEDVGYIVEEMIQNE